MKVLSYILGAVIAFGAIAVLFASCGPSVGYLRFSYGSQRYYARWADACDTLIAQAEPTQRVIRAENMRTLPAILRELEPDRVVVDTNLVLVLDRAGVLSHKIEWAPEEDGSSIWTLRVYSGDSRESHVVFSRKKVN